MLSNKKIKHVQLDPFGYCNAKCWFCPVKYFPQPEEGSAMMPIEFIDNILSQLIQERSKKDGIVDESFDTMIFSHYNEILLYKKFEELLALLRKHSLKCMLLSNGIPLSKEKTDLIVEYKDVVIHLGLNIPAFEKKVWSARSGFSEDLFDRLMSNLRYAEEKIQHLGSEFMIVVNGIDEYAIKKNFVTEGPKFKDQKYSTDAFVGEHTTQYELAQKMFKNIRIVKGFLYDRAGLIDHILSNKNAIRKIQGDKKVIGCMNGGDRTSEWLHINSAGHTFLCCNDYNFDYKFGDLNTQTIREIWTSDKRKHVIEKAFGEICTNCFFAKVA
jgi:MoaA/NifB/PqqE/SkfB family radical SAM enzyme